MQARQRGREGQREHLRRPWQPGHRHAQPKAILLASHLENRLPTQRVCLWDRPTPGCQCAEQHSSDKRDNRCEDERCFSKRSVTGSHHHFHTRMPVTDCTKSFARTYHLFPSLPSLLCHLYVHTQNKSFTTAIRAVLPANPSSLKRFCSPSETFSHPYCKN